MKNTIVIFRGVDATQVYLVCERNTDLERHQQIAVWANRQPELDSIHWVSGPAYRELIESYPGAEIFSAQERGI